MRLKQKAPTLNGHGAFCFAFGSNMVYVISMSESLESKGPSRREFLKGIVATGAAAAAGGAAMEAQAQDKKLPPGYDRLLKAAEEMYGIESISPEEEKKRAFTIFDGVQSTFNETNQVPSDWQYVREVLPGVTDQNWRQSPKAARAIALLEEWKKFREKNPQFGIRQNK